MVKSAVALSTGKPGGTACRSEKLSDPFSDNSGGLVEDAAEMRRLLLITAALSGLCAGLAGAASAHDGGERDGDWRGRVRPERLWERSGPDRNWADDRPRFDDRRAEARRPEDRRPDERRRPALRDDSPDLPPGPARRGGYLPDRYRAGAVDDYQRYRLRPPPRGYMWVRIDRGFALVSMDDGRIFDVIPD